MFSGNLFASNFLQFRHQGFQKLTRSCKTVQTNKKGLPESGNPFEFYE
jgi:hypothetical protein